MKILTKEKNIKAVIYIIIFAVILELTVFNFKFYNNIFNDPKTIDPILGEGIEKTDENKYHIGEEEKYFELTNLNTHVKNVYLDIRGIKGTSVLNVKISATDAGNKNYFDLPQRNIVQSIKKSLCIPLSLNGDTEKLKLTIENDNVDIVLNKITINEKVDFGFNIIRVLLVVFILLFIYIITRKSLYLYDYNYNSKKQRYVILAVILCNIMFFTGLNIVYFKTGIAYSPTQEQYHKLAQSLLNWDVYIYDEPPEYIKNMDNPYDYYERERLKKEIGEDYLWDTAYYNGKYYVYFGVVPCILFYIPAKILGVTITNNIPVLVMTALGTLFGYLLLNEIARRWFNKITFMIFMLISAISVNSMGLILASKQPNMYMVPVISAAAFSVIALFCWIKALPIQDSELSLKRGRVYDSSDQSFRFNNDNILKGKYLFIGSLCMALVAGCRPQLLMYAFFSIPLFWKAVFKDRELFSKKSIKNTFLFLVPFFVVAVFIMWYNYVRFNNIFDFGANYNLTFMDMVSEKFNFSKISLGLYTYFIQPPVITPKFPFLAVGNLDSTFMGNYVKSLSAPLGGIFVSNIIFTFLFAIKNVRNELKNSNLFYLLILLFIFPIVICTLDFNIGGIVLRYEVDFLWPLFIGIAIVAFSVYVKYNSGIMKKFLYKYTIITTIAEVIYIFLFTISGLSPSASKMANFVNYLICFWM